MKLVNNVKNAWRWLSVQGLLLLTVLPVAWDSLPADIKSWVPVEWRPWVLAAIAVATLAGRLIDQGKKDA